MLVTVKVAISLAEVFSAIICFILVWYMTKPYRLTGENSFLGLPLGFGIMGISHIIAAYTCFSSGVTWYWFMLLFRTFSFVFLATTYLFSSRSSKRKQYLWDMTLSALIVILFSLTLLFFIAPQFWSSVSSSQIYWRLLVLLFLGYIVTITLKNHFKKPEPMTLWIPFGFIFLAISQGLLIVYSLVSKIIDNSINIYWGSIALRFAGLIIFLAVAYRTYHSSGEDGNAQDS